MKDCDTSLFFRRSDQFKHPILDVAGPDAQRTLVWSVCRIEPEPNRHRTRKICRVAPAALVLCKTPGGKTVNK